MYNDVASFQQEMISAELVSPDAAAPATWLDKIFWGAWAENRSAPLLNEYENYSKNTSFEELFEQSAEQWSDTCKTALSFWAFGLLEEHLDQMSKWDYSETYKSSLVAEQTRIIENYEEVLKNYKINYRYNNIYDLNDFRNRMPENAERIPWKVVENGAANGYKYKWIDEYGNVWQARAHDIDPSAPVGSNASKGWIYRVQVKFGGKGKWFYLDQYGNFHIENVLKSSSIYYNEYYANATHIPLYGMWE